MAPFLLFYQCARIRRFEPDMREKYRFHAEICRAIAHPKRLEILNLLREGELSVGDLAASMGISPTNVSQQLAVLRNAGVVRKRAEGTKAFYRVSDRRVLDAFDLMTQVMEEQLSLRAQAIDHERTATSEEQEEEKEPVLQ